MKKSFLLVSMLFMSMMMQAQILYRISGSGIEKESYIMGTEHTIGGSFMYEIPGAFAAFMKADRVCGELSPKEAAKTSPESLLLSDGKTLRDVLSEEEFKRLDDCFLECMGKRLSEEDMLGTYGKFNPTMMSNYLNLLFIMKQKPRHMATDMSIDEYVQQMAMNKGKGTMGLETMEFQLKTLMSDPLEKQVKDLMCLVDNVDTYRAMDNELTEAYLSQDIERIEKAMFAKMGNMCDTTPEEWDRLLFNRNKDWAEKIPEIMKGGSTFFAVGVGHLCGDKSVLALLKNKGYEVKTLSPSPLP